MRKAFFFALICGVNISALAQLDVSNKSTAKTDKWVMIANKLPGSTGRILIDNPAGSTWTIYFYAMADEKYITSYAESNNKGVFVLAPGEYKITLNNVPVLNVPVKKGYDTKIKCGIFDVKDEAVWYLHDETGDAYYTSGDKPQKLVLPAGIYTYKIGGSDQRVVVKEEAAERATGKVIETDKWIVYPLDHPITEVDQAFLTDPYEYSRCTKLHVVRGSDLKTAGSLYLDNESRWDIEIYLIESIALGGRWFDHLYCANNTNDCQCPKSYPLPAGKYNIRMAGVWLEGVPILANHETRIKTGVVNVQTDYRRPWGIYDLTKDSNYIFRAGSPSMLNSAIVAGQYLIFDNERYRSLEMKDGQTVEVLPIEPLKNRVDSPWVLHSFVKTPTDSGRLNLVFDTAFTWGLAWIYYGGYIIVASNQYHPGHPDYVPPRSKPFAPGKYKFEFNRVLFENVPIEPGKETKIKVGYLEITTPHPWQLRNARGWNEAVARNGEVLTANMSPATKFVLPVGVYTLMVEKRGIFFIIIQEGKTVVW